MAQIHELIGKAMAKIGAIGKTSYNEQQKFSYRGIDAIYNALNPVMAELGLFICPEIIDAKREERVTKSGAVLTFTMLTIKYTMYAPDGSSVTMTVVGEGMDSGDKSSNKAMSVAMKYAMFQLFLIPTEDQVDPDRESYSDIQPKGIRSQNVPQQKPEKKMQSNVNVETQPTVPPVQEQPTTAADLIRQASKIFKQRGISLIEERKRLIAEGKLENIPSATMKLEEAEKMISLIESECGKKAS